MRAIIWLACYLVAVSCLPRDAGESSESLAFGSEIGFRIPLSEQTLQKIGPAKTRLRTNERTFESTLQARGVGGPEAVFQKDASGKLLLEGDRLGNIRLEIVRLSDGAVVLAGTATPSSIERIARGLNDSVSVTLSCTAAGLGICGDQDRYAVQAVPRPTTTTTRPIVVAASESCTCGTSKDWCLMWLTASRVVLASSRTTCSRDYCTKGFAATAYQRCSSLTYRPEVPVATPKPTQFGP
jgi:hypothetical protein